MHPLAEYEYLSLTIWTGAELSNVFAQMSAEPRELLYNNPRYKHSKARDIAVRRLVMISLPQTSSTARRREAEPASCWDRYGQVGEKRH